MTGEVLSSARMRAEWLNGRVEKSGERIDRRHRRHRLGKVIFGLARGPDRVEDQVLVRTRDLVSHECMLCTM